MNYVSSNTTVARIVYNESLAGNLTLMWGYGPGVVRCGYLEEVTHYNSSNTSGVAVTVAEAEVLPLDPMVNWTFVGRWSLSDQDHLRLVRNTKEPHMFDPALKSNSRDNWARVVSGTASGTGHTAVSVTARSRAPVDPRQEDSPARGPRRPSCSAAD